jgi:hypothetical protein
MKEPGRALWQLIRDHMTMYGYLAFGTGGSQGFKKLDQAGAVMRAIHYLAEELGMAAPVEQLGKGAWGIAYSTTHKRQVVKVTADASEILTWLAIRRGIRPGPTNKVFCGCVHVEIMGWAKEDPRNPRVDDWCRRVPRPTLAVIWKERLRDMRDEGVSTSLYGTPVGDEANFYFSDALDHNTGLRGRNQLTVRSFDGQFHETVIEDLLSDPEAQGKLSWGHRSSFTNKEMP